jgi:hypothetical protein
MATEPLLRRALRPGHDGAQPALDLVAADRDLFDMSLPQEGLELRIADLDRALARRFSGNKDEHGQRKHRDGERDRPEASEVFLGRLVPHDADLILLHPPPLDQYQRGWTSATAPPPVANAWMAGTTDMTLLCMLLTFVSTFSELTRTVLSPE